MKRILLAVAVLMAAAACNTNKCVIVGDVANLGEGYLYLTDSGNGGAVIDSVEIKEGKFRMAVDAVPTIARLETEEANVATIFIEAGKVSVSGDLMLSGVTVSGTPSNDAFESYKSGMADLQARFSAAETDEAREEINDEYDDFVDGIVERNKDNIFGAVIYIDTKGHELSGAEMLATLSDMPDHLKQSVVVKEAMEYCEKRMRTEPQAEGSDFVPTYIEIDLPDTTGKNVPLSSVIANPKNKYVLIDFWASWCGPCMGEMPHLKQAYAKYGKKGFEIYGVSLDSRAEDWKKAIAEVGMKWTNVSSLEGFKTAAADEYAVRSIPTNFLVDCSTGVIIKKNLRGDAVLETLDELL